jgi:hypothetical protein
MREENRRPLWLRLAWFALLWMAGIAVVGAIAFVIRLVIL